jgi:hypothetical protein
MLMNNAKSLFNKTPKGTLFLAGLAAFAYYKYSKMTPEERTGLLGKIKDQGKKILGEFFPSNAGHTFATGGNSTGPGSKMGEAANSMG